MLSTPYVLLDRENRVIGALAGQPKVWANILKNAWAALQIAQSELTFEIEKAKGHRRGEFPSFAYGLSFGGGQMVIRIRAFYITPLLNCSLFRSPNF